MHDPARGFVGGYEMETLSLGLPFMAAFLDPGAWGREFASAHGQLRQHGRHVDRRRGHAAGEERASRCMPSRRTHYGLPIPNVHFDDHANDAAMRDHAYGQGRGRLRSGRRGARRSARRPTPRRTISAPTG